MNTSNAKSKKEAEVYGLLAAFASPETLLEAGKTASQAGYRAMDGYTPFLVEGFAEAIGFKTMAVQRAVLIAGVIGAVFGYLIQYVPTVILYPINVGGRPLNSVAAFIPITFETTILFAALTAMIGMLIMNGLPRLYHPVFNVPEFQRASKDQFFLLIKQSDDKFSYDETRRFLVNTGALGVYDVAP